MNVFVEKILVKPGNTDDVTIVDTDMFSNNTGDELFVNGQTLKQKISPFIIISEPMGVVHPFFSPLKIK